MLIKVFWLLLSAIRRFRSVCWRFRSAIALDFRKCVASKASLASKPHIYSSYSVSSNFSQLRYHVICKEKFPLGTCSLGEAKRRYLLKRKFSATWMLCLLSRKLQNKLSWVGFANCRKHCSFNCLWIHWWNHIHLSQLTNVIPLAKRRSTCPGEINGKFLFQQNLVIPYLGFRSL